MTICHIRHYAFQHLQLKSHRSQNIKTKNTPNEHSLMMLLDYLALCPFHVKNKLSINKEVRGLVCSQVCSQVCTQRGHENGAKCLSSPSLATQSSPPCCCRVRKSPPAGAGPAAESQGPGGLPGRPQPICAEQPGRRRARHHCCSSRRAIGRAQ